VGRPSDPGALDKNANGVLPFCSIKHAYPFDVHTLQIVPTVMGDDLRISATSFMTYGQCPQSANERFKGRYGPSSRVSFTGSLAHQIFKRHLVTGPIGSEDFARVCKEEIGSTSRLNNTLGELRLNMGEVEGIIAEVRALYERFVKYPEAGFSGAEVNFEIAAAEGLELIGQIDAVFEEESGYRLVDWKTGALGEAEGQLLFYALLWILEKGEAPTVLEAISVKTGESHRVTPSFEEISRVAVAVGKMVDSLRAAWEAGEELERRGGPWCRYCPVLGECSEGGATVEMIRSQGGA
jgi:hypothetical protein